MSDDFLSRARMALRYMQGRVESGKLEMFEADLAALNRGADT